MNHRFFTLSAALLIVGSAQAQPKPETAWLIYPASESSSPAVEVWRSSGTNEMIWRLVLLHGGVVAEMKQPVIASGFIVNYGQCRITGVLRDDVLALVRHQEGREWSRAVQALWVADPKAKAFVAQPTKGVECRNEGYGI